MSESRTEPGSGRGVAVIGAGGHGRCLIGVLRAAGREPAVVFDDTEQLWGSDCLGVPIEGPIEAARGYPGPAVIAIGNNAARARISADLKLDWIKVIHPFSSIDPDVELGAGTVVMPGVVIQTGAKIGIHVIISIRASVAHDSTVGDFSLVGSAAHVCGYATLGTGVFLGAASTANNGVVIGDWSVVGIGTVVVRDLPGMVVAVGVPARLIKHLDRPYDGPRRAPQDTAAGPPGGEAKEVAEEQTDG